MYALLSRCYETEIDAAFADALAGGGRAGSDDELAAGFAALQADLADCDEDALEQLAVVFDRAFFGMGPRTAQKAFPYESVYTSEGGLMMQDAYAEVLRVCSRRGLLAKNPGFKEPEDHLAVELAFMALLCGRAALRGRRGGGRAPAAAPAGVLSDHLELDRPFHGRRARLPKTASTSSCTFTEDFRLAREHRKCWGTGSTANFRFDVRKVAEKQRPGIT